MTDLTISLLAQRGLSPASFADTNYQLTERKDGAIILVDQVTPNGNSYKYLLVLYTGDKYSVGLLRQLVKLVNSRTDTIVVKPHSNFEAMIDICTRHGAVLANGVLIFKEPTNGCC